MFKSVSKGNRPNLEHFFKHFSPTMRFLFLNLLCNRFLSFKIIYASATNSSNYAIESSYIQSKTYQRQIRRVKKSKSAAVVSKFTAPVEHITIEESFPTHKIDSFKACPAYQEGLSESRPRNKKYDIHKTGYVGSSSITQLLMHQSYLSIELDGTVAGVKGWRSGESSK